MILFCDAYECASILPVPESDSVYYRETGLALRPHKAPAKENGRI